jgi:hypothetical protein
MKVQFARLRGGNAKKPGDHERYTPQRRGRPAAARWIQDVWFAHLLDQSCKFTNLANLPSPGKFIVRRR